MGTVQIYAKAFEQSKPGTALKWEAVSLFGRHSCGPLWKLNTGKDGQANLKLEKSVVAEESNSQHLCLFFDLVFQLFYSITFLPSPNSESRWQLRMWKAM